MKKIICRLFGHKWSEQATWYTFLNVPYDHHKCERCGMTQIMKVYSKDMEQEMIDYNKEQEKLFIKTDLTDEPSTKH